MARQFPAPASIIFDLPRKLKKFALNVNSFISNRRIAR